LRSALGGRLPTFQFFQRVLGNSVCDLRGMPDFPRFS
jgi:hypothetical protein